MPGIAPGFSLKLSKTKRSELSCHAVRDGRINDGSVKAFPQAKRDLLRHTRGGTRLVACLILAFSGCEQNEPIGEAKAAGTTTADCPRSTTDPFKPLASATD